MSNEYKDWFWDKLADILLEDKIIDKATQVIPWYSDCAGVVHGIKDGIHVKYTVWLDDEDETWKYELSDN